MGFRVKGLLGFEFGIVFGLTGRKLESAPMAARGFQLEWDSCDFGSRLKQSLGMKGGQWIRAQSVLIRFCFLTDGD